MTRSDRRRRRAALAAAALIGVLVSVPARGDARPSRLTDDLDVVVAASPPDTCLVVAIDGVERYAHRPDDPQAPASTQKLLTAAAALERLGGSSRFTTSLRTTAPVRDGVVAGDVILVGGGDPTLMTSLARAFDRVPSDQPTTLLDALARRLREAGIRRVEGQVLGDESRFDAQRSVASWPARFVAQNQSGPLSALAVDQGYLLEAGAGGVRRVRSADPPTDAARALRALMAGRGIEVVGGVGSTVAPERARTLVAIESPPLREVVADVIRRSDNHGAEVLLKHLGVHGEGQGSTASGARTVAAWSQEVGAAPSGSFVADGSGLDPTNLVTCRQLVRVLDRSGPDGELAAGLPVAGRSGTLTGRFRATSAEGRLRAKTGRLNGVSALAGFVALQDGSTATFAYVANASAISPRALRAQDLLAEILGRHLPECPPGPAPAVVVPLSAPAVALVQTAVLSGGGGPGAVAPTAIAIDAMSRRGSRWLDRCSQEAGVPVLLAPGRASN